jgi:DNA-binding response OmpR family regulator
VTGYLGARKTILVVDDDLNHLQLVDYFLAPIGFAVLLASSAEQALEMIEDIAPDLFILDIDLPGHDGWHLAQMLRNGAHRSTPIAMISGHAMDTDKPSPELKLCDAFLAKPYNLDDLLVRIGDLLRLDMITDAHSDAYQTQSGTLTDFERAELISLARDGLARALTDRIDALESSGALTGETLTSIRRAAHQFDMAAVVAGLEGAHDVQT